MPMLGLASFSNATGHSAQELSQRRDVDCWRKATRPPPITSDSSLTPSTDMQEVPLDQSTSLWRGES
ncbi:hypothetical protein SKAU_G00345480 [Synaphobranchus kaupii]|uniref:Uncharacterized protein n=1 Tax=Synaphobranchus kaupii TaxID=118154 RepID=A0A9Q1IGP6_SYNKA|nr:hypothetical protein SKAU_G00345480 [Synaphobranchus kaupii]